MSKVFVQTRIDEEIKVKLEELANNNGLSFSALLRLILIGVVNSDGKVLKKFITNKPINKILNNNNGR
ncbi:MAG: type II toxin-antitoxin system RelB/DinJ family antitoxin [bacterium]